jgi:hypothetical protein
MDSCGLALSRWRPHDGEGPPKGFAYYAIMELRLLQQNANIAAWAVKRFDVENGSATATRSPSKHRG